MQRPKHDRLTELVDIAFGVSTGEAATHDGSKLEQLKKVARAIQVSHFDAPADVLERAYGIVAPSERRRLRVQLLRSTIGLAGARLERGDETQVVVDAEGTRVRVMYGRDEEGWNLMGRVEGEGWFAECAEQKIDCGSTGQFSFAVADVSETGIRFTSSAAEFEIKPFEELVSSD